MREDLKAALDTFRKGLLQAITWKAPEQLEGDVRMRGTPLSYGELAAINDELRSSRRFGPPRLNPEQIITAADLHEMLCRRAWGPVPNVRGGWTYRGEMGKLPAPSPPALAWEEVIDDLLLQLRAAEKKAADAISPAEGRLLIGLDLWEGAISPEHEVLLEKIRAIVKRGEEGAEA